MDIFKAVKHKWPQSFGEDKKRLLVEDVNRNCVRVDDDHGRVSELNSILQENMLELLQHDIEVSCIWHRSLLCSFGTNDFD